MSEGGAGRGERADLGLGVMGRWGRLPRGGTISLELRWEEEEGGYMNKDAEVRKYHVYLGDVARTKGWNYGKKDHKSIFMLSLDLVSNHHLLLSNCVTLGKSLNLSEPQFPSHL